MIRVEIKKTLHIYRGFEIHGGQVNTEGGWVLGGRYFKEGGIARNYVIKKEGMPIFHFCIIKTLKDAKKEVDDYINRNDNGQD